MKKIICLLLLLALTLSLCACGDSGSGEAEPAAAGGLQMGYGRESIMPEGPINISGGANAEHRESTGFLDILYATCVAVSENGNTILLFSTDTLGAKAAWTREARQLINEATGIPEDHIHIAGTHTQRGLTGGVSGTNHSGTTGCQG